MRKLTRKQLLARLFVGFFALGSLLCTVNSAVAGGPSETYGEYYYNNEPSEFSFDNLNKIKIPGSNNIINLTITGPDSPAPDIYSGYTDSDGDIKNNKLTITTNEGVTTKLSNVYGGYIQVGTGSATLNEVYIASSTVNGSVYGGYTNNGSATQNIVDIASSTVKNNVYGGYTNNGNVLENKVNIASSTLIYSGTSIKRYVYGGYTNNGSATQNIVDIASCTVKYNVYGGYTNKGNVLENKVNIASSTLIDSEIENYVYGGYVKENGDVVSNNVTIKDSEVDKTVYGGYVGTGSANLNEVHIASSTVRSVWSGYAKEGNAVSNSVAIASSTVKSEVSGGYAKEGNAASNSVAIASSNVTGAVYGGNVATGNAASNSVAIAGSTVNNNVYGGIVTGSSNNSALENKVTIAGSTVGSVYGGNVGIGSATQNIVNITSGSTVNGAVYGGRSSNGNADSNEVKITNSSVAGTVNGGYVYNTGSATQNVVDISSSTLSRSESSTDNYVYGGYVKYGDVISNKVIIKDSEVNKTVSGGYVYNTGSATQNIVDISSSTVTGVYGGYTNNGNVLENKVNIASSTVTGYVFGGQIWNTGSATENVVDIASSTIIGFIYGGCVYGTGSATQNIVAIAGSTVGSVYCGYAEEGNAASNSVHIASSTVDGEVRGGCVSNIGSATQNIVNIASSTVNNKVYGGGVNYTGNASKNIVNITSGSEITGSVLGGYTQKGDVISNKVTIENNSKVTDYLYGVNGGFTNSGNATSNEVKIASSTVNNKVYGGWVNDTGNASKNIVNITSGSEITGYVYGGYVNGTGSATQNIVDIASSTVKNNVYGGYINNGNVLENKVDIASSNVNKKVYGGSVGGTGSATQNVVDISSSTLSRSESSTDNYVYGGYVNNGDVISNKVIIKDSEVNKTVSGGYVDNTGSATQNIVNIASSTISGSVCGGIVDSGSAAENKVYISSSTTGNVNGGEATTGSANLNEVYIDNSIVSNVFGGNVNTSDENLANALENKVYITSSTVNGVYGGYVWKVFDGSTGSATKNEVHIASSTVTGSVYGGYVGGNGNATDNTVEISGGSEVTGSVYGGDATGDARTGNKLIIAGAGNTIGGQILNFETMTFDATDVKKDETMLSLTTKSPFTIGVKSIETNNADLSVGEKIILISSAVDNKYDGSITYKIDGKQAIDDGSGLRHYIDSATEDADKIVHVDELAYVKEDNNLNLCKTTGFITGLYNGFDAEGAKQTLGQAEMTISSVPQNVTKVYGAYSEDADVIAGGATINLETTELSDVNLIGSYNKADETKIDISKNTLNVNVSGVKVKSVEGFDTMNFKLASDGKPMFESDGGFVLNGVTINSLLPEYGFNGSATILNTTSAISSEGAKFKINDTEVDSAMALTVTTKNTDSVVYGTYTYGISSEIITLTGKSIVSAMNINSGETQATDNNTLKVTGNMAEKYTELYGAFNADGGAATGATVELSEAVSNKNLIIYGGYSTGSGADMTTGNTLKILKNGNEVKNIQNFSGLAFALSADIAAGTTMLSTVDKVVLGGASLNTEMSGIALGKGEKIVLLDNADKGNAELKLNGKAGDQTVVEENSSFVAVSSLGYNTDDNKIAIECKDAFAAGCYIDEKGKLGKDTLTLGSSAASNMRAGFSRASEAPDMSGYKDIYGVYSAGSANPTGATIEIVSAIDYSNSVLHGGYKVAERAFYAEGNTLRVKSLNSKVKGITDFETMEFDLPAETKNGDTMLKVTEAVDMAQTKTVVEAKKATGLKAGDSVNLIDSEVGIQNFDTKKYTVSGLTDKTGEVKVEDKALVFALDKNGEKPNDNTKAPVEGISATMALVSQAGNLVSEKLDKSMTSAAANGNGEAETFAAMGGGHEKYETGSYVEADSWNIGFGLAKKGLSKKNPDTTYGLFFQYGKSSFDTHNDGGFRGDGDSKMFGAGLMFHQEARSKYYYQGSIYAGKVDAKWNCSEGGYDDDAAYWGMTFGMGRKHSAGGNKTMDVYGRYSFNHVGSMNGDLNGLKYSFDSTDSHNLRFGFRMEYAKKNSATAYWGLAWEHEFAGDSTATVATLGRTESPTLKGDSGIAEVGYQWKRGNWEYNINAEGSFGKREGVTGSFNINYNF